MIVATGATSRPAEGRLAEPVVGFDFKASPREGRTKSYRTFRIHGSTKNARFLRPRTIHAPSAPAGAGLNIV